MFGKNEASAWGGRPDEFYLFQVAEGATYRYTSSRLPIYYQGFEYLPKAIERSDFTFKKDYSGNDSFDIEVQADLDIVSLFQIITPRKTVSVVAYRRHRGDSDLDAQPFFIGRVRGCEWEGAKAKLTCDSLYAMAKRGGLNAWFQVPCNYFLYDAGCRVQKEDWKVTGVVSSVSKEKVQCAAFASKPDGWFKYGFIESGNIAFFIVDHKGDTVTLLHGVEGVHPGDTVFGFAGCDRSLEMCWNKFSNGLNHLGFKWSPADNVFVDGV